LSNQIANASEEKIAPHQAAGYAQAGAKFGRGEIRVLKKDGSVENVIPFDATGSRP
jgi:hypothetical protein